MKQRKGLVACLVCLLMLAVSLYTVDKQPVLPQSLLSPEERMELYRFPKSILEATEEDLCCVDGIGERKARAILLYLDSHELSSMTQLKAIRGIGEKNLKALQQYFYLPAALQTE